MADRLSQYSMGHNFVPGAPGMMNHHQLNAMQQQQPHQLGQQQQDSSQQPHPGMSGFNDQNRVWSQMQQMRAQNGQDVNAPSAQQASKISSYFSHFPFSAAVLSLPVFLYAFFDQVSRL
ncbi:hypothetical protein DFJ43DRAFT_1152324 [Lentinula guzmanii]|uniref:Uncharacterized protein n=2 Tax=Lentinula TaxID=5352 RepID=A0AA38JPJ3_9AGAR|nr:hypothetical protein DFJ43DRAFT_1152324 [Lentinula guzmanii]KAJ3744197.1 hypothetical protein DFH05DRAFT_1525204 [Lentinula detonsa]KAJ3983209.1 hypothetical protein F5890DRAFT_1555182 [Lentinula detonsa]